MSWQWHVSLQNWLSVPLSKAVQPARNHLETKVPPFSAKCLVYNKTPSQEKPTFLSPTNPNHFIIYFLWSKNPDLALPQQTLWWFPLTRSKAQSSYFWKGPSPRWHAVLLKRQWISLKTFSLTWSKKEELDISIQLEYYIHYLGISSCDLKLNIIKTELSDNLRLIVLFPRFISLLALNTKTSPAVFQYLGISPFSKNCLIITLMILTVSQCKLLHLVNMKYLGGKLFTLAISHDIALTIHAPSMKKIWLNTSTI